MTQSSKRIRVTYNILLNSNCFKCHKDRTTTALQTHHSFSIQIWYLQTAKPLIICRLTKTQSIQRKWTPLTCLHTQLTIKIKMILGWSRRDQGKENLRILLINPASAETKIAEPTRTPRNNLTEPITFRFQKYRGMAPLKWFKVHNN